MLCPICFEGVEVGETVWRLPCTHAFHEVCMVRYLRSRLANTCCPMCRCDIKRAAAASLSVLS